MKYPWLPPRDKGVRMLRAEYFCVLQLCSFPVHVI
ncbi:hypothetical protein YYU_00535 [Anaplasma phagocytophilum str. HZ2]|nr:hypothetical protein YYU_00535 [Anaplasma phagocytophilum str. HZ2]AGR80442.1 hypothetical protein WSQ_00535 [Anaplasma phagocytophilum str. JM]AGR81696.1 hypothetical protein YYY_00535 [Anaplasma phagocytophilum str. Dog2]